MVLALRAEAPELALIPEAQGSGTGTTCNQTWFWNWLYLLVA